MWAHNYGSGCFAAVRWPWYRYMHMYCTHWMTFILLLLSTSYTHIYTHSLNQHLCYLWIAALANDGYIDAVDNDTVGLLLQVFTFSKELSSKEWFYYMPLHSNDQMEWDDVARKVNDSASNFHSEHGNRVLDDALLVQPYGK